ncbi:oxygen-binding di-iron domain-containing protein [Amycolatopsis panacis]|uniref:MBL fold metallo-hydrolase n=1 Tax=Amycolatopsis panacis TaxID=2340917 RepID=A0A419I2M2_9PSEU|nr:MBL fold metallo-hydrolase [Amycolatopsis panacis]RJQ84208.1 MBL fold metallo-hydrolase [Amycolatopsis panacis]
MSSPEPAAGQLHPLHLPPQKVAAGTYLVQAAQQGLGAPLSVHLNSAVFQGAEPIIVDTGSARNRDHFIKDVFSLVEPADVRWVFLSHDDSDHTGNLAEVIEMCPNATLLCSWALVERFGNAYDFPLRRCRWVNDGDSVQAGDRTLVALRPPVYDSPATRGLLDTSTGVYWAADAFATPVPGGPGTAPATDVAELDPQLWWDGMVMFGVHALAPWLSLVDRGRYAKTVRNVQGHRIECIISGHSPVIGADRVAEAFDMIGRLADTTPPPCPDQQVLELMLHAMGEQ